MNFQQLVDAVYIETNRPDLVAETQQAVLETTLSIHTADNFYKDIKEAQVVFDNPTWYLQTLVVNAIPFFRNVAYIRKTDPTLTVAEQTNTSPQPPPLPNNGNWPYPAWSSNGWRFAKLKEIDLGDILDHWGYEKTDVYYRAGQQINIKSSTPLQYATIGYYAYPQIDIANNGAGYSSWVANEYPYAIIYGAAGGIFAKIGQDKSWAIYMREPSAGMGEESGGIFYKQMARLRRNNILVKGR